VTGDLTIKGITKQISETVTLVPGKNEMEGSGSFKVRLDEKITAPITLEFIGESSAVKELGGVLVKSMDEIEVEALPSDLPHEINVDVSAIKEIDGSIYVKDLPVTGNYEIVTDPDTVIATVTLPEEEVVEPTASVEDIVTEGEAKRAESAKAEAEEA
jgi:large subunit ribosomal protein L25